jgi:hypothetical protein
LSRNYCFNVAQLYNVDYTVGYRIIWTHAHLAIVFPDHPVLSVQTGARVRRPGWADHVLVLVAHRVHVRPQSTASAANVGVPTAAAMTRWRRLSNAGSRGGIVNRVTVVNVLVVSVDAAPDVAAVAVFARDAV